MSGHGNPVIGDFLLSIDSRVTSILPDSEMHFPLVETRVLPMILYLPLISKASTCQIYLLVSFL